MKKIYYIPQTWAVKLMSPALMTFRPSPTGVDPQGAPAHRVVSGASWRRVIG